MKARNGIGAGLGWLCAGAALLGGAVAAGEGPAIAFETETLANGLRVVYAPMPESTVAHVRVLYHVGSKDESPDRRGFAHMFEHMMFRGSAHVAPEEHMRLLDAVGGYSNAYTGFDETVYVNTVPANQAELPLWLEADRMASFRVSPEIFATERRVVEEEWRIIQNNPFRAAVMEIFPASYSRSNYRWAPIGDMEDLRAARTDELNDFFRRYYVPNNAVLVVAGGMDVATAKQAVSRYFGWIPAGSPVKRVSPPEPERTEAVRRIVPSRAPLPAVYRTYLTPPRGHPDQDVLSVASFLLGYGKASRLYRALVGSADPLCMGAQSFMQDLDDGGLFAAYGMLLAPDRGTEAVEAVFDREFARLADEPVGAEELARVKTLVKVELVNRLRTAESVASALGDEMLASGDPGRVNTLLDRLDAVTAADVQRVARQYLRPARAVTVVVQPDPAAPQPQLPPEAPDDGAAAKPVPGIPSAPAAAFPAGYPAQPPATPELPAVAFAPGAEATVRGVRVLTFSDHRLPTAQIQLALRRGSASEPADRTGLAALTAEWVRRGPAGMTPDAFDERLEAAGVNLTLADRGEYTLATARFLSDPASRAAALAGLKALLTQPAFAPEELADIKAKAMASLASEWSLPDVAANATFRRLLFGETPMGRMATKASLEAIGADAAKAFYEACYRTGGAVFVAAGDVDAATAAAWAEAVLADARPGEGPAVDVSLPPESETRTVTVVDNPAGQQASIAFGVRAYPLAGDEKYAGWLANNLLSESIHSRMLKRVRAELGLVYGLSAVFRPERRGGSFAVRTGTKAATVRQTIDACFEVLDDMRDHPVPDEELAGAQRRVVGEESLRVQTAAQRAERKLYAILAGWPEDFFDRYGERMRAVTAADIQALLRRYVDPGKTVVVVAAPKEAVLGQLESLGPVTVRPMEPIP